MAVLYKRKWIWIAIALWLGLCCIPRNHGVVAQDDAPETKSDTTAPPAAGDAEEKPDPVKSIGDLVGDKVVALDTVWVLLTAFLVMWMQAGFALVETGLTRAKNAVNICMKNLLDFCFGSLAFWAVGFALMFGNGNAFVGLSGWRLEGRDNSPKTGTLTALINDDIKEAYDIDLGDADTAEKYKDLVSSIDKVNSDAVADTKSAEDKIKVSLTVPAHDKFEKEYSAADFYWGDYGSISWTGIPLFAKFFFQLVFAATTATIVSGAMAERTKFVSYMVYSFFVSALIYPISGHWIWGGGWLATLGFWDFAGSTVVHSLGGWLSLVGAFVLGPRIGKYDPQTGKPRAFPGHNLVYVTLGVFILWLGWFGFNPGSTMAADPNAIAAVTVVTNAAAATAAITAIFTAKLMFKKWEGTMALNGALAGLVAITCPCAWVSVESAIIIGAVAGVLVVVAVVAIDRFLRVDDPVGAISVHGVCGTWGTLSLGLFSNGNGDASPALGLFYGGGPTQLINQAIGVVAVFAWAIVAGGILFLAIKYTIGLRVSAQEEQEGLDFGEHGNEAYHGFQFAEDR